MGVLEEDVENYNNDLQYIFDVKIIQKDTNVASKEDQNGNADGDLLSIECIL